MTLEDKDFPYKKEDYLLPETAEMLGLSMEEFEQLYEEVVLARRLWVDSGVEYELDRIKQERAKRKGC